MHAAAQASAAELEPLRSERAELARQLAALQKELQSSQVREQNICVCMCVCE